MTPNLKEIIGATRTFANRYARMCVLRVHIDEDHSVIDTERMLIDRAKLDLQKQILSSIPLGKISDQEPDLRRLVKKTAIKRVMEYDMPIKDRDLALRRVWSQDFNDLIPVIT